MGTRVGNLDGGGVSLVVGAFVHSGRSQRPQGEQESASVVGHVDAFAHIEASLAHTTPHALLVVGAAQVGKTAVMNEVARRLHLPLVRINPAEAGWPLSGLSALAAALGGTGAAAVDAEVRRERERAVPADDLLLADRLLDAIRAQSTDDVILVDDVDLMDQRSTTVLGFLMRRLGGTSLRMIASISAGPVPSEFDGVPRTVLGPLPRREAIAFARSVFPTADPGVATLIADASGGLAGVIGTARLTPEELDGSLPLSLPPRRGDLHPPRTPLTEHAPTTAQLLRMLAIAPFADPAALVGDDRDRVAAVDRLLADGVIALARHRLRIVDTALRADLLDALDLAARTELHAAAADAHRDVDPALRLWHESFAGADVGADLLIAAAALIAIGDVAAASEFAERGCMIAPADRLRDSALLGLAGSLCDQGEFALARLYLSRLSSDLVPSQRVREMALSLVIDHAAGEPLPVDRIDAVIDRNLAADAPGCARLLTTLLLLRLDRGELDKARDVVARIRAAGSPFHDRLMDVFAGALPQDDPATPRVDIGEAVVLEMWGAMAADRHDRVRRLSAAFAEARAGDHPAAIEAVRFVALINEVRAERGEDVARARDAWLRAELPERRRTSIRELTLLEAEYVDADGRVEDAGERLAAIREQAVRERNRVVVAHTDAITGAMAAADGRPAEAVPDFRAALKRLPFADPARIRTQVGLVDALAASGESEAATAELENLRAAVAANAPSAWRRRALAHAEAACAADDSAATRAFTRLLEEIPEDAGAEYARVRFAMERRLASPRPGSAERSAALALFEQLSPGDGDVVRLVQRGLRNHEIARELFVSQRTVELRLTRVYRLVGVSSRARLIALLNGDG